MSSLAMKGPAMGMAALSPVVQGLGLSGFGGTWTTALLESLKDAAWVSTEALVMSSGKAVSRKACSSGPAPAFAASAASPVHEFTMRPWSALMLAPRSM